MNSIDPIGIFLASSGSRGDRLLFRFPYETEDHKTPSSKGDNPSSMRSYHIIAHMFCQ